MTATALQRLLKYPHAAVFDKAPQAELALRVRHPAGAAWSIADEGLTVRADGAEYVYSLAEYTLQSLADALRADGFEVPFVAPNLARLGASVLVEGSGDQGRSNGDHLHAFTSPLWVLMGGYAREVRAAEYQAQQALRQMVIPQAENEWLDLWGKLYATKRRDDELDADYAPRIPKEAFRIRVNGLAIEEAVRDITGKNVEIREPWRQMFTLDSSQLSGADHLPDEKYYGYFLIHPVAREAFDWADVLEVIQRNRAAGIEVYAPSVEFPVRHVQISPPAEYRTEMGSTQLLGVGAWPAGETPLGVMRLDDNEFSFNHPAMVYQLRTYSNIEGAQTEQVLGKPRNVARAAIVLSDGAPLGDENAILSRGQVTYEAVLPETLSKELAPSDYEVVVRHERVERVSIASHVHGSLDYPVSEMAVHFQLATYRPMSFHVRRITNGGWSGAWDGRRWYGEHVRMGMNIINTPAGDVLNDTLILNVSVIK